MDELEWAACKLCFAVTSLSFNLPGIAVPLMLDFCLNNQQLSLENQTLTLQTFCLNYGCLWL
jgi:hypothetical protein